jgi:uracil-DNA glycosylase
MNAASQQKIDLETARAVLQWYVDAGVDVPLSAQPQNLLQMPEIIAPKPTASVRSVSKPVASAAPLGSLEARDQAIMLAQQAQTLADLNTAIQQFEGLAIKRTATQMVFADGNPHAPIMVVGEAPGLEEDAQGKPFVGASGQLLDKMLAAIGLDRHAPEAEKSVYITNVLNWRPPGNRTPTQTEIDVSLPFLEKHILLIRPKIIFCLGGVAAKALVSQGEGITRLRGKKTIWSPQIVELGSDQIPVIPSFHPSYLLRAPLNKRLAWQDLQLLSSAAQQH